MTTEDDFQAQLDKVIEDHQTRLVFADWLQERDDPRADGYRALAIQGLYPYVKDIIGKLWLCTGSPRAYYEEDPDVRAATFKNYLPLDWYMQATETDANTARAIGYWYYLSRREAEDAAALGFSRLNGIQQGIYLKRWDSSIYLQRR